ncbi:flagellar export chaperone FlgN [Clostridium niameyense]|uniref:flagellar export chaperone FlgN n=1 Tax=Clostridium niameyense TaxID=1622073 RepID=UPI00067E8035|nr:flagellar export chaperone FlgN [Clostridium niameyense]
MEENLKLILKNQYKSLKELLELLEKQHKYLCCKNTFGLDKIVEDIEEKSKELAKYEMERRSLTKENSILAFMKESKDDELQKAYNDCLKVLNDIKLQKDTNELIIRQGISLTTSVLTILNPDKSPKTYGPQGRR